jgi:CRP/FNR family transcriptional regulator
VAAETTLFQDGDACQRYLLVLDGSVRVQKVSSNGREITLYRVGHGETCVLTTTCLLANRPYPAVGVAETEVRAIALDARLFQELLGESPVFRQFVFSIYARRIADLIELVEAVAFARMDVRLAALLLASAAEDDAVNATHHELAAELGSAREVVSRLLKDFEQRGLVSLQRARIGLLDRRGLAEFAAH